MGILPISLAELHKHGCRVKRRYPNLPNANVFFPISTFILFGCKWSIVMFLRDLYFLISIDSKYVGLGIVQLIICFQII